MTKEAETAQTKTTRPRKGWKLAKRLAVFLVIIGLAGFGGYYFKKYNDFKNNLTTDQAINIEKDRVLSRVSKIYSLPQGEDATLYYIRSKEQFLTEDNKKSELFRKVETGDYLISYTKAKIVILFRPSTDKIVDTGPLNAVGITVAIIGTESMRNTVENLLKNAFQDSVGVVSKEDSKSPYQDTVVVDVSGKNAENAKKIAEAVKGKVGTLPPGEAKPQADILVIAGSPAPTTQ